jgi:hypothetical protein
VGEATKEETEDVDGKYLGETWAFQKQIFIEAEKAASVDGQDSHTEPTFHDAVKVVHGGPKIM